MGQTAERYFTVKLQVTNIGDEARTLFASNQKLIINGKPYEATSSITDDGRKEDINPGPRIDRHGHVRHPTRRGADCHRVP